MMLLNNLLKSLSRTFVMVLCACFFIGANTTMAFAACGADEIATSPTECVPTKFSVTTTPDATELKFAISATGTFFIDCGDGGNLRETVPAPIGNVYYPATLMNLVSGGGVYPVITRRDTKEYEYRCTWSSPGAHTVRFGGSASGPNSDTYSTNFAAISFENNTYVASVSGSLGALFPTTVQSASQQTLRYGPIFLWTFAGCTNLTSIPENLFSGVTGSAESMFDSTFHGTGITSIPENLFSGVTGNAKGMFTGTFGMTGITSIPENLFSGVTGNAEGMFVLTFASTGIRSIPENLFSGVTGGANNMFASTFANTSIRSIPENLFSGVTGGANNMFAGTFANTSIRSIPENLFSGVSGSAENMFFETFGGCGDLTGYIPPSTFSGLITNGSPMATNMWERAFRATGLATSCPAGTRQYITGYESEWGGLVSCEPVATCPANQIDVLGDGSQCEDANFTITTTSMAAGTTFEFKMTARGTFYVDWGDGTIDTIVRDTITDEQPYSHVYRESGTYTIRIGGSVGYANRYSTNFAAISFKNNIYVASVSGSLGALFPTDIWWVSGDDDHEERDGPIFPATFAGCTNLTSIPDTLFSRVIGSAKNMFLDTFAFCTNLTSIPENLFSGVTGSAQDMFNSTFSNTNITSIPENLFSGVTGSAQDMFNSTFSNTNITSIPENLFSGVTGAAVGMFSQTFHNTNITSIPENLFSGVTGGADRMFYGTFNNTGITSIPDTLFSGVTGSAGSMFSSTFSGTGIRSIPENLFSGVTGGANDMFASTFSNTGITSIPENLFSGVTGGAYRMFANTFTNTGITSIPENLFSGVTASAVDMFFNTFYGCTNLTGYIPPSTFSGLITNGSPMAINMWERAFRATGLATSCPAGTRQYITGYESEWGGKVSCEPDVTTCPANQIDVLGDGSQCEDANFTITTTSMAAGTTFEFKMTAMGTFYVDWGDGSAVDIITRNNVNETTYTHTYNIAGTYTIRFGGAATQYRDDTTKAAISFQSNLNVAAISGSLGKLLPTITAGSKTGTPRFAYMFSECSNLTGAIPEKLFDGIYGAPIAWMFRNMFEGTAISEPIPANLFADIAGPAQQGVFAHMFKNMPNLQGPLPDKLFAGVTGTANYLYANIFEGSENISGPIPENIFGGLSGAPALFLFRSVFSGCKNLSGTLPEKLFQDLSGVPAQGTFYRMFQGCEGLSGYIPPKMFDKITQTTSVNEMMEDIFDNSGIATSCEPFPNTMQYITGFEPLLNGRVSCYCDDAAIKYGLGCYTSCPVKQSLELGSGESFPLLAQDPSSPSLKFGFESGDICYVPLVPGVGRLNVSDGTNTWHADVAM